MTTSIFYEQLRDVTKVIRAKLASKQAIQEKSQFIILDPVRRLLEMQILTYMDVLEMLEADYPSDFEDKYKVWLEAGE